MNIPQGADVFLACNFYFLDRTIPEESIPTAPAYIRPLQVQEHL